MQRSSELCHKVCESFATGSSTEGVVKSTVRWPTSSLETLTSSPTKWPYPCFAHINGQTAYGPFSRMPGSTYERDIEEFKEQ
jgi:hypothetical protein